MSVGQIGQIIEPAITRGRHAIQSQTLYSLIGYPGAIIMERHITGRDLLHTLIKSNETSTFWLGNIFGDEEMMHATTHTS